MKDSTGVFEATRKNGDTYYRASVTYKNKHISIGNYSTFEEANKAYKDSIMVLNNSGIEIEDYDEKNCMISFVKWVVLINFRDNKIYFKTPIYLKKRFFLYYLSQNEELKFDIDDLFYFSDKTIMKRGGRLFVNDYGLQTGILSRYGVKNHAVEGRDYYFKNNDSTDFRYGNIVIINSFVGVEQTSVKEKQVYKAKIHINGYWTIGHYETDYMAAIAYNKAADYANSNGVNKNYQMNYIETLSDYEYNKTYEEIVLPDVYIDYINNYK